jgi:predicted amidohydrolase
MPTNIVVVMWSPGHVWNISLAVRLFKLNSRLAETSHWISLNNADLITTLPFKAVFVAPEYYFTKNAAQREPLTEADRIWLETQLLALSKQYPDILIVPGTIFYQKPLVRNAGSAPNKFDPATGQRTLAKTSPADRRQRTIQSTLTYISSIPHQRDANDNRQHKWVNQGYDAGGHAVPSIGDLGRVFRDVNKNPAIVKNAAYLLLGGRRIAKYDKQTDWAETRGSSPDDFAFIPGTFKQCPEIKGYRFGTEICYDHGNGMLARRNIAPLHFHFLVSDWVHTNVGNMAMSAGGYFVHASTNYQDSALWWRNPNGNCENISVDVRYWKYKGTQLSRLDGYVVPLPAPLVPPRRY